MSSLQVESVIVDGRSCQNQVKSQTSSYYQQIDYDYNHNTEVPSSCSSPSTDISNNTCHTATTAVTSTTCTTSTTTTTASTTTTTNYTSTITTNNNNTVTSTTTVEDNIHSAPVIAEINNYVNNSYSEQIQVANSNQNPNPKHTLNPNISLQNTGCQNYNYLSNHLKEINKDQVAVTQAIVPVNTQNFVCSQNPVHLATNLNNQRPVLTQSNSQSQIAIYNSSPIINSRTLQPPIAVVNSSTLQTP